MAFFTKDLFLPKIKYQSNKSIYYTTMESQLNHYESVLVNRITVVINDRGGVCRSSLLGGSVLQGSRKQPEYRSVLAARYNHKFLNLLRFRFVVSYRRDQLHLSKGSREHYVSISIPDQNIYLVQSKSNVDSLVDSSPSFIQTSSQASSKNVSVVANAWSIEGKDWSIDHESSKTVPIRTIDLPSSIEDDQNPHQRITPPLVNKLSKALQVSDLSREKLCKMLASIFLKDPKMFDVLLE